MKLRRNGDKTFDNTEALEKSPPQEKIYAYTWHRADWANFSSMIRSRNFDLSNLTSSIDTTRAIESLTTTIRGAIEESVPTIELKTKFATWWTPNFYPQESRERGKGCGNSIAPKPRRFMRWQKENGNGQYTQPNKNTGERSWNLSRRMLFGKSRKNIIKCIIE
jgi:hypothetical protein